MKSVKIGLIGAGTVGSGLIQILTEQTHLISNRSGIQVLLQKVCDANPNLSQKYPNLSLTTNYTDITRDPEISMVVELVGGTGVAYDIVKDALVNGKTVVTANKALLSEKGQELFELAQKKKVEIGYEASVGGTIPIIRSIKSGLIANEFQEIYGILNGTTNFILTKMEEENLEYSTALKLAQDLGYAEKDPTFDVEGIDTAHKVSLLAGLAFGKKLNIRDMYVEGISNISKSEIKTAHSLGYRIKLLGICKQTNNKVEARVQPTMLPLEHSLSSVKNEMNAIFLQTNYSGSLLFSGKGAGSLPTASAILADIVFYSSRMGNMDSYSENNQFSVAGITPQGQETGRFYIRFNTIDKPGVLAEISHHLGKNNISISTVRQDESPREPVEVIILTHKCNESNLRSAIQEIDQLSIIQSKSVLVRLEELG
jgi:homoserine dehydrogenase